MLHIEHREIRARRRAGGVVWFDFKELCGGPRSQNDYLELATQFHTVLLSDVPQMSPRLASEARRFTWLVDVLYDRRVKLIMSAAVPARGVVHRRAAGARVPAHRVAAARDAVGRVPGAGAPRGRYVADMKPRSRRRAGCCAGVMRRCWRSPARSPAGATPTRPSARGIDAERAAIEARYAARERECRSASS